MCVDLIFHQFLKAIEQFETSGNSEITNDTIKVLSLIVRDSNEKYFKFILRTIYLPLHLELSFRSCSIKF